MRGGDSSNDARGAGEGDSVLIGERIELVVPEREHAALLASWGGDPAVQGAFYNVWPRSAEATAERLPKLREPDFQVYLIVDRTTREPMGTAGFADPHAPQYRGVFADLEVFYQVHPRFQGKGIATEAARLLVNHLFQARPLPRLTGYVLEGNAASCRVLEKAGMTHEGVVRGIYFLHGQWTDLRLYGITRAEWGDEASYRARGTF
jgi:RimJ/RimL family protein N-acetyltransferase